MKFRPCIDLHNGKVKQIVGGSLTDSSEELVENFIAEQDAAYFAAMYKKDRLLGGHVIMLGAGNQEEAIKALHAYPNGLQVGGGIKAENAELFLDEGASHVIVTSYVFNNGLVDLNNLDKMVAAVSKERLVLDLSCRKKADKYFVVTDRWQKFTDFELSIDNLKALAGYADEFLVHAADVEGKCEGMDEDLIRILAEFDDLPVTYAGGIRSFKDLYLLEELGQRKINFTVGSALDIFGGDLAYQEIVESFA